VVLAREQARWAAGCHQNIQTDPIPARTVGLQTEFVAPQVCVDSVCKYIYISIYICVCVLGGYGVVRSYCCWLLYYERSGPSCYSKVSA
jgi:hypothetical protein